MYRFWTGTEWTSQLTANPAGTPPPTGPGPVGAPDLGPKRSNAVWWITGLTAILVIGLIIFLVTRGIGAGFASPDPTAPGGVPSQNVCPQIDPTQDETPPTQPNDGRVHGGKISYPMLASPWGEVQGDNRVPFGRDVAEQIVPVEIGYDGDNSWVASVLVAELVAGDGFFTPQQGSEIVMKCVVGKFYSDAEVGRDDKVSKAATVDGHDAWVLESHLTFDIPNLKTKGELAIIVIVDTGVDSASLFYASIPDTTPQFVDDARQVMQDLKVDA